ncbi:glycerophosphodiester phosphodiesterase [Flagellimonas sp.]|uniref:glycerophosphodiester phosphodiesterase n=1 Tax=Flagellimonas sp. TaxID=2058762 RepID=UPI003AB2B549
MKIDKLKKTYKEQSIRTLILVLLVGFFPGKSLAQFNANGVVAHRSAWKKMNIPQNSIEGLVRAVDLGCYAAEIDIHLTKDNIPVVNHDHDLHGIPIETTDYKDLLNYKLANGEKMPTLEEYIIKLMEYPKVQLWVDIKNSKISKDRTIKIAEYAAKVVGKLQAEQRIEFIGPNFDALVKVLQVLPRARVLYIGSDKEPKVLKELGFLGVDLGYKRFASGEYSVYEAQKVGLLVGSYTVDDRDEMKKQLSEGVDFITTNEPELLFEVLEAQKRK